jgi:hypothetical protein
MNHELITAGITPHYRRKVSRIILQDEAFIKICV